jgi:hypothetical protein
MTKGLKALLTILCFWVFTAQIIAQTPNYTGTWVLNLEKSQLESPPKGLTSSLFIIKQEGDKFKLKRYHIFGSKKKKISFKMVSDGKTRRVKVLFKGKLEWKDSNLQASIWTKGFSNIVNYKFGNNQNEFIADEVYSSKPHNYHNIWVFEKDNSK